MYRAVLKFSDALSLLERILVYALVIALPLLVLVNTLARTLRVPFYWMDELAILCMVWLAMLTMSLTLKSRDAVAVTMLLDIVPPGLMKIMKVTVDLLVLTFGLVLLVLSYRWFDPLTLISLDFDFKQFSGRTFNFMYQDTTSTLGLPKFWFWLIVPFAAFGTSVHALANLLKTLAATPHQLNSEHHAQTAMSGELA
ncbi:TRAP transporter small permease [Castellaniella ginsengisoli]